MKKRISYELRDEITARAKLLGLRFVVEEGVANPHQAYYALIDNLWVTHTSQLSSTCELLGIETEKHMMWDNNGNEAVELTVVKNDNGKPASRIEGQGQADRDAVHCHRGRQQGTLWQIHTV